MSAGSKRAANVTALGSGGAAPVKGGPVQVIFNGKIVTPQSLVAKRASTHHDRSKKPKGTLYKPQTIDESASETGERTHSALSSKLHLKR